MGLKLKYKNNDKKLEEKVIEQVPVLVCQPFIDTGLVSQCFTTRLGGVSTGVCATMNLSERRGDDLEAVKENRRRIAKVLDVKAEQLVYTNQIHSTNVARVYKEDCGKTFLETDGLITNESGIGLVIFGADCVPVLVLDPVHRAIGACHCGWRGTVNRMPQVMIRRMEQEFGSRPEELLVCIGPSICQECYEVSEDVIQQFREGFSEKYWNQLFYQKANEKYQLDLWEANAVVCEETGVKRDCITIGNVCTHCNPEVFFSHRTMGDKRGLISGCISLK